MSTTITSEQITAISNKLIAMSGSRDVDHLVTLDTNAPVIKVSVRTSKKFAETWQKQETFFVGPTGHVDNGETTLFLKQDDKVA